jgi:alpha-L-fucosidase
MYLQNTDAFQHHVATWGPHHTFGYKDFIPLFKARKFDAAEWADLFRKSGARFVVPVAEHHDGFAMYDCGFSRWTATRMGPRRDIIGELAQAVRQEGMVFGLSSHRVEHWWFMNGGMQFHSDVQDPAFLDFYGPAKPDHTPPDKEFMDDWLARCCELVDKYEPQLFWFDWWIEQPSMKSHLRRFAAYYYNRGAEWGKGVAINYKNDAYTPKCAVFDIERGQLAGASDFFWQTDTAVARNSWGYVDGMDYKPSASIVADLVDIVSKNGALLLNIGPRPDGTIPHQDRDILTDIGQWLAVNGEAIYQTRPWKIYGEGPTQITEGHFTDTKRRAFTSQDIRFTAKGRDTLYAIVLNRTDGDEVAIHSLGANLRLFEGEIGSLRLLGSRKAVTWTRDPGALRLKLPGKPVHPVVALEITRRR